MLKNKRLPPEFEFDYNYTIYITEAKIENIDYVIALWNLEHPLHVCRIISASNYINRQYFFAGYIHKSSKFFDISPLDMFILINNKTLDNSLHYSKIPPSYNIHSWTEILECLKNQ